MTLRGASILSFFLCAGCVTPAVNRSWTEIRTDNFVIWTAEDLGYTEKLARELETFHQVVGLVANVGELKPRVPTTLFVIPGYAPAIGLTEGKLGFFVASERENVAVIRTNVPGRPTSTLYHEYVHFIVRNRDDAQYPRWFDEGFASFLSTVEVDDGKVHVGKPLRARYLGLTALGWMDFRRVVEADHLSDFDDEDTHRFYGQAWLLVHYLHWGRKGRRFSPDMDRYRDLIEAGKRPAEAFETAFDLPLAGLEEKIRAYVQPGFRYRQVPLERPIVISDFQRRPIPAVDAVARLGVLAHTGYHHQSARAIFEHALRLDPDHPGALAGEAHMDAHDLNWPEATKKLLRAVELEPESPYHHLDLAHLLLDRARAETEDDERTRLIHALRHRLDWTDELRSEVPESLALRGASYLLEGQDFTQSVTPLIQAYRILPSSSFVCSLLADALAANGRTLEAAFLLRRIVAWSHGNTKKVQLRLDELERRVEREKKDEIDLL